MTGFKLATIFFIVFYSGIVHSFNICGDWAQYKDIKCIKVLQKKVKGSEANAVCAEYDSDCSLISIHSEEEQEFVNNLLDKFKGFSNHAWIGMKSSNKSYELFEGNKVGNWTLYKWMDGTDTKFDNWADDAIKDGSLPCVKMSLNKNNLGKWKDDSCKRGAHLICHKKQSISLNILRQALEGMEKKLETIIPLGFLYTQLPEQLSPQEMWPTMNWTEVTQDYAGLFFRALGNGSNDFGEIQHANQSLISDINYQQFGSAYTSSSSAQRTHPFIQGEWTSLDSPYGFRKLSFFPTEGEVRPKNTAVRIWKRIG